MSSTNQTTLQNNNNIELAQPSAKQAMIPTAPSPETLQQDQAKSEQQEVHMRGGEACPGRFCFIIPCPLPCNFCVFPCPC